MGNDIHTPKMKGMEHVAIAYNGGKELPYFEQTLYFELYNLMFGKKVRKMMLSLPDSRLSTSISTLQDVRADVVICRGFAPHALHDLKKAGIKCLTFEGSTKAALRAYMEGKLEEL